MVASCTPWDPSATVSFSGHWVAARRRRRSASCASETLMRKGRIASPVAAGAGYAGNRLAAPAAAIPIAAVLKSWRRSWLIASEPGRVRIVNLLDLVGAGARLAQLVRHDIAKSSRRGLDRIAPANIALRQ